MKPTKKIVLDKYFYLSGFSVNEPEAFDNLLDLFSKNAVLEPPEGKLKIQGAEDIKSFFMQFFEDDSEVKYVWKTVESSGQIEAEWIACGRKKQGDLFTVRGIDTAKIDENGKIEHLKIQIL